MTRLGRREEEGQRARRSEVPGPHTASLPRAAHLAAPVAAAAPGAPPSLAVAARGACGALPGSALPLPRLALPSSVPDVLVRCHFGRGAPVGLACAAAARRGSEGARGAGASVCVSHRYLECERRRASGAQPEPEPSPSRRSAAAPRRQAPPRPRRPPRAPRGRLVPGPAPAPDPGSRPPASLPPVRGSPGDVTAAPRSPQPPPPPLGTATMNPQCARCGKVVYPTEKVNCLDKVSEGRPDLRGLGCTCLGKFWRLGRKETSGSGCLRGLGPG